MAIIWTCFIQNIGSFFDSNNLSSYQKTAKNIADEKVLGKSIDWKGQFPHDPNMSGDGWYVRKIGGHPHTKIMLEKTRV